MEFKRIREIALSVGFDEASALEGIDENDGSLSVCGEYSCGHVVESLVNKAVAELEHELHKYQRLHADKVMDCVELEKELIATRGGKK